MPFQNVAIIGAGLGGLSLSLFLKNQGIDVTIYELRRPDVTSAGAIMLSPNALKSLDAIGVYDRIKDKGYHFRDLTFNNNEHEYMDAYEMGNADKYGYDALRIYRQIILDELRAMVLGAGIQIVFEKKFSHIVSETDDEVKFAFTDSEEMTVDLLVGADGIHSTVRKYLVQNIKPTFSNVMAVTAAIPTAAVKKPHEPYPMPVSLHGKAGAFVMAPQNPEGSELLVGIQWRTEELTREAWDALWADKEQLLGMMRSQYDDWNPMVQSAMDVVPLHTLSIWPYYTVPELPTWRSHVGRVVLVGDAGHAIPPAAGQGVNQAFEDAHSLSVLLGGQKEEKVNWSQALQWWQQYRQERIGRVTDLTNEMNKRRLPGWTAAGGKSIDCSWLFGVDVEEDVKKCWQKRELAC